MSFHAYLKKIFDEKGKFATLDDISLTTKTGTYRFPLLFAGVTFLRNLDPRIPKPLF